MGSMDVDEQAVASRIPAELGDGEPGEPRAAPGREAGRRFEALRAAWPGWVAGHLLVILVSWHLHPKHPLAALSEWDTVWYRTIAQQGYGDGSLVHFFPLTSGTAWLVREATRIPAGIALFSVVWLAGLLFGAALYRLTLFETGDRGAARRAAWLIQLAPGAYALVMGYTEPLAGLLGVLYFLCLRSVSVEGRGPGLALLRRHGLWLAALLGLLAGVSRPTGILLVAVGLVEGLRIARAAGWRPLVLAETALAAAAPVLGLVGFLAYSKIEYGSWTKPLSQQMIKQNRGAVLNDPLSSIHFWLHGAARANHGLQTVTMCLLLIFGTALLIVFVARKLPLSYLLWTLPSFAFAITSHAFTSLPRYVGALFPVVMVLAVMTGTAKRWQRYAVYAFSVALLVWTSHTVLATWLVA